MFVEKIAGALAAEGAPLAEVKAIAERVVDAARSIGFALTSCTTPMAGRPTFALGPDEIEFGVGIHGEQGIGRRRMATARELAEAAIDHLLDDLNPDFGAELLMLTNGLGGTPESELYLLHGEAARALTERGAQVVRHLVGPTSPASTWPVPRSRSWSSTKSSSASGTLPSPPRRSADDRNPRRRVRRRLDERRRGRTRQCVPPAHRTRRRPRRRRPRGQYAARLRRHRRPPHRRPPATPGDALIAASKVLRRTMGGTSGPLWSAALRRAGRSIGDDPRTLADALA